MAAFVPRPYTRNLMGCAYDLSVLDPGLGWSIITDITISRDVENVKTLYSSWPMPRINNQAIIISLFNGGTLKLDPLTKDIQWQRWPNTPPVIFFYEAICDEAKEAVIWLTGQLQEMIDGLIVWPL